MGRQARQPGSVCRDKERQEAHPDLLGSSQRPASHRQHEANARCLRGATQLRTLVYYTYEALEWRTGRALNASGTGRDDVAWPEVILEPGERVRDKKETCTAAFASGDKTYQTTLPEQQWRALEPGGSCRLELGILGGVKKVTPADT